MFPTPRSLVPAFLALSLLACSSNGDGSNGSGGSGGTSSGGTSSGGTSSGGTSSGGTSAGGTSTGGTSAGGTSSGGTSSGGAAGSGGTTSSGCTQVVIGDFQLLDTETGGASLAYALTGLDATQEHVLYVEFFDVAGAQSAGSFDLSQPPDDNYSTCAHCLLAFEDVNGSAPTAFFQESGSLVVTTADTGYTGKSAGSFSNVRLAQVTLQGSTSTKVPNGRCLELSGAWDHTQ
jgi:hypothetical protein